MTRLEKLRYALNHIDDSGKRQHEDRLSILAAVPALLDLAEAVARYRSAVCLPGCVGENHVEACAGHAAMDDIFAASNRIEAL